jgi:hypothetical protein
MDRDYAGIDWSPGLVDTLEHMFERIALRQTQRLRNDSGSDQIADL